MGFPFDRPHGNEVNTLDKFLLPNMKVQDVIIKFTNKAVLKEKDSNPTQVPN